MARIDRHTTGGLRLFLWLAIGEPVVETCWRIRYGNDGQRCKPDQVRPWILNPKDMRDHLSKRVADDT